MIYSFYLFFNMDRLCIRDSISL